MGLLLLALVLAGCAATPVAPPLSADQLAGIVASPDRSAADQANDQRRKPEPMLAFIGVRPGMVALDLSAGGGYTSELLARAIGPTGQVFGQSQPRPTGNPSAAALAQRQATLQAKHVAAAPLTAVVQPFASPVPEPLAQGGLDLATLMFNYHDLGHMGVDRAAMNRAIFQALKPGGLYVIADHAGRPGTGISEAGTLHRIEEVFLEREVEAAGFKLVARGDFLRNPADPRDQNTPNPPQPKDEFVLKFVRP
jgi:predicted methyltransferase